MKPDINKFKDIIIKLEERNELLRNDRNVCTQYESKLSILHVINDNNEIIYRMEEIIILLKEETNGTHER